jgi:hypothetical protein
MKTSLHWSAPVCSRLSAAGQIPPSQAAPRQPSQKDTMKNSIKSFRNNFGLLEKFRKYFGKTALFRNNFGLFFLNGGAYGA